MAIKSFKVGTLNLKKDRSGQTIKLGVPSKNPKYQYFVDIRVRDSQGNTVAVGSDCFLRLLDPREREGITEEQKEKIPEFILKDVVLTISDES